MGLPDGCVLRTTLTSPFGRKVRMALILTGNAGRVTIDPASTLDPGDTLRQQNPLGKLPVLLLPCGSTLYDSRTILVYLAQLYPECGLFPTAPLANAQEMTRLTLADGITDAALLLVYEGRFRDACQTSPRWVAHQRDKIARALRAVSTCLPDMGAPTAGCLALACALGYLDWRQPVRWRGDHPALVDWLARFERSQPELAKTLSPAPFLPDAQSDQGYHP